MSKLYVMKPSEGEDKLVSPLDQYVATVAALAKVNVELQFVGKEERASDEYKKKNPNGTCPTFETKEGTITESQVIARFLAEKDSTLRGTGFKAAQVDQVMEFVANKTQDAAFRLWHDLLTGAKTNKADVKTATAQYEEVTKYLNSILVEKTFLLGNTLTLADVFVFFKLRPLFEKFWEPEVVEKDLRPLRRWFKTIAAQSAVKKNFGATKLKEKKAKQVDSKFNLEDWKRVYMNSTAEESIAYFWKNLDPRANSVWIADYKYSEDFKADPLYKTANLMSGQAQRAQPFAKFTFGVLCVVGEEEGDKHITCLWVYESTKFPEEIKKDNIDYDMFDWKRADWKKDKDAVEEYLKAETVGGKKVLECKVFR